MLKQSTMGATTTGNFVGSGTLAPGQVAAILGGAAYCEVDTSLFPMGEIRGQLALATFVPAVSKWHMILLAAALALVGISFPNGRTKWFKRAVTTTD
jgi:Ca2+/H+ antiporter